MKPALKWEVFYPHPAERVWSALVDPEALGEWLQPEDDVISHHIIYSVFLRRVLYSWKTRDFDAVVCFDLSVLEGGTNLRVQMDECFALALDWLRTYLHNTIRDPSGHRWVRLSKGAKHGYSRFPPA